MAQNKQGQILLRLDRRREAAQVYARLTEHYAAAGFLLKAIATCKMVLEADPGHQLMQRRLAELYAHQAEGKPREVRIESPEDATAPAATAAQDPVDLPPPDENAQDLIILGAATPLHELAGAPAAPPVIERSPQLAEESLPEVEPQSMDAGPEVTSPQEQVAREPGSPEPEAAPLDDIPMDVELPPEPPEVPAPPESPPTPLAAPEPPPSAEPPLAASEPAPPVEPPLVAPAPPPHTVVLPQMPLFSDLPREAFVELLERMRLIRVQPGELILREGEEGHSMFVIARGQVRVLRALEPGRFLQLAQLGEGAFFGEMAVLRGGPRGASVQATRECELFEIERALLDEVARRFPAVEEVLKKFAHQRMLRNVLATSPLFRPFEGQDRVRLIERFLSRDVSTGETLIAEGQNSDGLYIVLRGRLDVVRRAAEGREVRVGELREGEVFGEYSCLHQEPARATVRAPAPASVLRLPREVFSEVILTHPQILEMVTALGEHRRALTLNSLAERGVMI